MRTEARGPTEVSATSFLAESREDFVQKGIKLGDSLFGARLPDTRELLIDRVGIVKPEFVHRNRLDVDVNRDEPRRWGKWKRRWR
jgi:hypothetical protein